MSETEVVSPQEAALPDPEEVQRLAHEALQRLKAAQTHLHEEAEALSQEFLQIDRDRQEIKRVRSELQDQQTRTATERANLDTLRAAVEREQAEFQQAAEQWKKERETLEAKKDEFVILRNNLARERDEHAAAVAILAERERAVELAERRLNEMAGEIEPRQQFVQQREADLAARADELENYARELTDMRETLIRMQEQLAQSQHEVAHQREELLARLGSTAPPAAVPRRLDQKVEPVQAVPTLNGNKPKSAGGVAAEQFRKLRRDAKRRAIGA